jgi:hypothetical protein
VKLWKSGREGARGAAWSRAEQATGGQCGPRAFTRRRARRGPCDGVEHLCAGPLENETTPTALAAAASLQRGRFEFRTWATGASHLRSRTDSSQSDRPLQAWFTLALFTYPNSP